jgi:hypothetical protein
MWMSLERQHLTLIKDSNESSFGVIFLAVALSASLRLPAVPYRVAFSECSSQCMERITLYARRVLNGMRILKCGV